MIFTIPKEDILSQLKKQLDQHFSLSNNEKDILERYFPVALSACNNNFLYTDNKYYSVDVEGVKTSLFNPYHSVQYMIFLYYLSHEIYMCGVDNHLCDKIYYLNKIFHSVDLFYAIQLPAHFGAEHPLGSVMGRAKYSDGFFFYQGCTVGGTRDKQGNLFYPEIGENCHMFSNSSILGNCHIGKNVNIGAGCIVKNQDVPDCCTVFGESPNLIVKYQ